MSKHQKRRQRARLRAVDKVVDVVSAAMAKRGQTIKQLETWRRDMPREEEMLAKDKYTSFDRKVPRTFRKGLHSMFLFFFSFFFFSFFSLEFFSCS